MGKGQRTKPLTNEGTAGNNMFALWPGDQLNFSTFIKPTFGFVRQHAASEAGHIANTNVMHHARSE
jgi:hypothetical protein